MDINKADYGTVIKFGNLELFKEKMKLENQKYFIGHRKKMLK